MLKAPVVIYWSGEKFAILTVKPQDIGRGLSLVYSIKNVSPTA